MLKHYSELALYAFDVFDRPFARVAFVHAFKDKATDTDNQQNERDDHRLLAAQTSTSITRGFTPVPEELGRTCVTERAVVAGSAIGTIREARRAVDSSIR